MRRTTNPTIKFRGAEFIALRDRNPHLHCPISVGFNVTWISDLYLRRCSRFSKYSRPPTRHKSNGEQWCCDHNRRSCDLRIVHGLKKSSFQNDLKTRSVITIKKISRRMKITAAIYFPSGSCFLGDRPGFCFNSVSSIFFMVPNK